MEKRKYRERKTAGHDVAARFVALVAVGVWLLLGGVDAARGCTSAIVASGHTAAGKMLLWKHRDSGHRHNFVAKVERGADDAGNRTMAFVGLFNAGDVDRREVWAGMNEAGLGIMNTASYNLAPDTAVVKDMEGVIMAEALKSCRTADDFLRLLDGKLADGAPLGVQANFGVIDAGGHGLYVEAWDWGYKTYDLADEPSGCMVRSNYSYSGGAKGRLGEVRHDNAVELLRKPLECGAVTPLTLTEGLSRSFYDSRLGRDMLESGGRWVEDKGEMIPRRSSCASVVIEGGRDGEMPVMWVAIGFPTLSQTVKVTIDSVPAELLPQGCSGHSPLCDKAVEKLDKVMKKRGGKWWFDMDLVRQMLAEE